MPKVLLKRTSTALNVPTISDLDLGEIGINTYDGKLYIKKDSGTPEIIEIGASITSSEFIATAGQTVFNTTYDVTGVQVFVEGILIEPSKYSALDGTSITFDEPLQENDVVLIYKIRGTYNTSASKTSFVAGAGQTVFNVSYDPEDVDVYVEGLLLDSSKYTAIDGSTITVPDILENNQIIIKTYI